MRLTAQVLGGDSSQNINDVGGKCPHCRAWLPTWGRLTEPHELPHLKMTKTDTWLSSKVFKKF